MKVTARKHIKIDLQVRKRKMTLESPLFSQPKLQQETKTTIPHKKLTVTINQKNQKTKGRTLPLYNPENSRNIRVSEFNYIDTEANWNLFPKELITELQKSKYVFNYPQNTERDHHQTSNERWVKLKAQQKRQKEQVVSQIIKKQSQIEFYINLFNQKEIEQGKQKKQKIQHYQQYIQNLIKLYQSELQKTQNLHEKLGEKESNDIYKQRRLLLNKEGRLGLNFSPKQLSTFSGMSGITMLLSSAQRSFSKEQMKRSEIFSFGSDNKLMKSQSAVKDSQLRNYFLNPLKNPKFEKRKLTFKQASK